MLEFLGLIAVIFAINIAFRMLFAGARAAKAGVEAAVTGKSFDEAMGRMSDIETKIVKENTEADNSGLDYYSIKMRGLFPIQTPRELAFAISLFDVANDTEDLKPVLSLVEQFQEPYTTAYHTSSQMGRVEPGEGFVKWVEIGRVLPLILQSPFSGTRTIRTVVRLVDSDKLENIRLGYSNIENRDLVWIASNFAASSPISLSLATAADLENSLFRNWLKASFIVEFKSSFIFAWFSSE